MLLSASPYSASGKDIEFNTDFLDVKIAITLTLHSFLVRVLFCRASTSYKLKLTDRLCRRNFLLTGLFQNMTHKEVRFAQNQN